MRLKCLILLGFTTCLFGAARSDLNHRLTERKPRKSTVERLEEEVRDPYIPLNSLTIRLSTSNETFQDWIRTGPSVLRQMVKKSKLGGDSAVSRVPKPPFLRSSHSNDNLKAFVNRFKGQSGVGQLLTNKNLVGPLKSDTYYNEPMDTDSEFVDKTLHRPPSFPYQYKSRASVVHKKENLKVIEEVFENFDLAFGGDRANHITNDSQPPNKAKRDKPVSQLGLKPQTNSNIIWIFTTSPTKPISTPYAPLFSDINNHMPLPPNGETPDIYDSVPIKKANYSHLGTPPNSAPSFSGMETHIDFAQLFANQNDNEREISSTHFPSEVETHSSGDERNATSSAWKDEGSSQRHKETDFSSTTVIPFQTFAFVGEGNRQTSSALDRSTRFQEHKDIDLSSTSPVPFRTFAIFGDRNRVTSSSSNDGTTSLKPKTSHLSTTTPTPLQTFSSFTTAFSVINGDSLVTWHSKPLKPSLNENKSNTKEKEDIKTIDSPDDTLHSTQILNMTSEPSIKLQLNESENVKGEDDASLHTPKPNNSNIFSDINNVINILSPTIPFSSPSSHQNSSNADGFGMSTNDEGEERFKNGYLKSEDEEIVEVTTQNDTANDLEWMTTTDITTSQLSPQFTTVSNDFHKIDVDDGGLFDNVQLNEDISSGLRPQYENKQPLVQLNVWNYLNGQRRPTDTEHVPNSVVSILYEPNVVTNHSVTDPSNWNSDNNSNENLLNSNVFSDSETHFNSSTESTEEISNIPPNLFNFILSQAENEEINASVTSLDNSKTKSDDYENDEENYGTLKVDNSTVSTNDTNTIRPLETLSSTIENKNISQENVNPYIPSHEVNQSPLQNSININQETNYLYSNVNNNQHNTQNLLNINTINNLPVGQVDKPGNPNETQIYVANEAAENLSTNNSSNLILQQLLSTHPHHNVSKHNGHESEKSSQNTSPTDRPNLFSTLKDTKQPPPAEIQDAQGLPWDIDPETLVTEYLERVKTISSVFDKSQLNNPDILQMIENLALNSLLSYLLETKNILEGDNNGVNEDKSIKTLSSDFSSENDTVYTNIYDASKPQALNNNSLIVNSSYHHPSNLTSPPSILSPDTLTNIVEFTSANNDIAVSNQIGEIKNDSEAVMTAASTTQPTSLKNHPSIENKDSGENNPTSDDTENNKSDPENENYLYDLIGSPEEGFYDTDYFNIGSLFTTESTIPKKGSNKVKSDSNALVPLINTDDGHESFTNRIKTSVSRVTAKIGDLIPPNITFESCLNNSGCAFALASSLAIGATGMLAVPFVVPFGRKRRQLGPEDLKKLVESFNGEENFRFSSNLVKRRMKEGKSKKKTKELNLPSQVVQK